MGERALEAARRRAADLLERGETPDLIAILREECALEPRDAYDRAIRAIAETAARAGGDGEEAVARWARSVRAGASLYLALGEAVAWLREHAAEGGEREQPPLAV